ncbi:hypothetical protein KPL76_03990 [Subtercola sp. PAMC28395]|uniref:hypothetical protein n=1 Tax=Subtercola sp. PAMC28395 TaxID=2846775 RepID=UPI001C0D564C|nr:hypothetical protein [Subtercola sp. PAMC28395]QWT24560.1 hypothetical protein KPL76_03990 [Subtercola sp. PAMC28395]
MTESQPSFDVPALLKLPSIGSSVLFVAYSATVLALAYTAGGDPMRTWQGLLALVLALASAVLVLAAGTYPLARGRSALIAAAPAVVAYLITLNLRPDGLPGWTAWYVLSGTLVLLALAVRGRIAMAWVGFAAVTAVNILWAVRAGRNPLDGLIMMQAAVAILVFGSLFAVGLRTLMGRLHAYSETEHKRAASSAAEIATAEERRDRVVELDALVREPLTILASDLFLSADFRSRLRALEGELRDRVSGANFLVEPATVAIRAARARGVDVLFFDDVGLVQLHLDIKTRLAATMATILDAVDRGSATLRLSSEAPGTIRLSAVTEVDGDLHRSTQVIHTRMG